jgi:hypothetical protein
MLTIKKSLFMLKAALCFVAGLAVFSCEQEDNYLSLSVDALTIPVEGNEVTFTIQSNAKWDIAVADSWAKVSRAEGNGQAAVTVKAGGNYSDDARTTILTVFSGALRETVVITQNAVSFSLSMNEIRFDASGTALQLGVTANASWALYIPGIVDWCEADVLSGNGDGVITLTPKPYTERKTRDGKLIFNSFNTRLELAVSQAIDNRPPAAPELRAPANDSQGELIPVHFSWTASADDDDDEVQYFLCLSSNGGQTWNDTVPTTTTNATLTSKYIKKNTAYSWKVVARDLFGGESVSEVSHFVSGETNDGAVTVYQQYSATDVSRGVNLVIMGDGFIEEDYEENGAFDKAVETAVEAFFAVEPYPTYREYFTVYKVTAYSEERGATVKSDFTYSPYQKKQNKTTVFGSVLDGSNSTGIACNANLVYGYALKIPGMTGAELANTAIILLINLDVYAGTAYMQQSGRSIAMCPLGVTLEEIVQHEAGGHGFGRLLDEYIYYKNEDFPSSNLRQWRGNDAWIYGANLDITGNRNDVHWKHYFDKPGYEMVGLFEGGGLYGKKVWRPEQKSCMDDNRPYYNAPSREAIVRRIMKITDKAFDYDEYYSKDDNTVPVFTRSASSRIPLAPPILVQDGF